MTDSLIQILDTPFIFGDRPESIPGDMRPVWRVGLILLLLRMSSRGNKSSIGRIHLLNWAIRSRDNQRVLIDVIEFQLQLDSVIVRIEPSLNRAADFAHGEKLIRKIGGDRLELTMLGTQRADELISDSSVYVAEKTFLAELGKKLTERIVNILYSGRL